MEYKYSTINEVNHFEFGEAVVGDIQLTAGVCMRILSENMGTVNWQRGAMQELADFRSMISASCEVILTMMHPWKRFSIM